MEIPSHDTYESAIHPISTKHLNQKHHLKPSQIQPGLPELFQRSPLFRGCHEGALLQVPRLRRRGAVTQRIRAALQQQRQAACGAPDSGEEETGGVHVQTCAAKTRMNEKRAT